MPYVCFVKSNGQAFLIDEHSSIDDAQEYITEQVIRNQFEIDQGDTLVCMNVANFHIEEFVLKDNPRRVLFE